MSLYPNQLWLRWPDNYSSAFLFVLVITLMKDAISWCNCPILFYIIPTDNECSFEILFSVSLWWSSAVTNQVRESRTPTMRARGQEWMLAWYTQQLCSLALFQFDGHSCSWQNFLASDPSLLKWNTAPAIRYRAFLECITTNIDLNKKYLWEILLYKCSVNHSL